MEKDLRLIQGKNNNEKDDKNTENLSYKLEELGKPDLFYSSFQFKY